MIYGNPVSARSKRKGREFWIWLRGNQITWCEIKQIMYGIVKNTVIYIYIYCNYTVIMVMNFVLSIPTVLVQGEMEGTFFVCPVIWRQQLVARDIWVSSNRIWIFTLWLFQNSYNVGPPNVPSWFITPCNYGCLPTINHSNCSYKPT